MAITKFVTDLHNAITGGNSSTLSTLLEKATAADWSAAGSDITEVLDRLMDSSRFASGTKGVLATTIVSKGTVDVDAVTKALYILAGNELTYSQATSLLNAASTKELSDTAQNYGEVVKNILNTGGNMGTKGDLIRLLVSKTDVAADAVTDAIYTLASRDTSVADAARIINTASAKELSDTAQNYGEVVKNILNTGGNMGTKGDLIRLLVSKTDVAADAVSDALYTFASRDTTFANATKILNAASTKELSDTARNYGDILKQIINAGGTSGAKGELARLLISKTAVDAGAVSDAIAAFSKSDVTFAEATKIINAASAKELSDTAQNYGYILKQIANAGGTSGAKGDLATLLVSKTAVDADSFADAVFTFARLRDHNVVEKLLAAATTTEKSAINHTDLAALDYKSGNDNLTGTSGADTLYGYGGDDNLWGYDGNDILFGGSGNDRLNGHKGTDRLTGGTGQDTFVISYKDAVDTITDFKVAERDILTLHNTLFSASKTSVENALEDFVFARTSGSNTIISIDADGRGSGGAVDVAILQNVRNVDIRDWHSKGLLDIE